MSPRWITRSTNGSALISAMSVRNPAICSAPYGTSPMTPSVEASVVCAFAGAALTSTTAVRSERSRRIGRDLTAHLAGSCVQPVDNQREFTPGLPRAPRYRPRCRCRIVLQGVPMTSGSEMPDGVEGTGLGVTRRRRRGARLGGRRRAVAVGAAAVVLLGAGVTYASTDIFGHNQVGTEYADGIQVSDDQLIQPLGRASDDPAGQVHGLDGQPGRPLPRGHEHRQVGRAADLRPAELQAHLVGRHRGVGQPAVHATAPSARTARRTRPTASCSGSRSRPA